MNNTLKTKIIFYLFVTILLINIFFKGGWDLWVQTLTHLLTILLFGMSLWGNFLVPKIVLSLPFLLLLTGLVISLSNSVTPVTSIIYFYNQINYLLIFLISILNFSKYQKQIFKYIIYLGPVAATLDLLYPILFHTALFPNPNIKVGFLLLIIPLYFDMIINTESKIKLKRFIIVIFCIPILISFYTAYSNWGNIVFIFTIFLYAVVVKKIKKFIFWLIPIFVIIVISCVLINSSIDINNRISWLKSGISMFSKRPLTGFGLGSASHILPVFTNAKYFSLYIHSFFIQFAAENGVISIIGLVWLIISLLKRLITKNDHHSHIIFISLISVMIYNFFEYNLTIPIISLITWFLLGSFSDYSCFVVLWRKKNSKYIFCILLFVLLIFMGSITVKPFISTRYFSKGIYKLRVGKLSSAEILFNNSLEIFPDYYLPRIGLAIKNIFEEDLESAKHNIYLSIPIKQGNPVYRTYNEGVALLNRDKTYEARRKFLEVIRFRLIQYGLDPEEHLTRIN